MDECKLFLVNAFIQFLEREKLKRDEDVKFLSKLNAAISFLSAAFQIPVDDSSLQINSDLEEIFYLAVRYDLNPRTSDNTKITTNSSFLNQQKKTCIVENTYSCKERDKTLSKKDNVSSHKRSHHVCNLDNIDLNQRSKIRRKDNSVNTNYEININETIEGCIDDIDNNTDCDIDIKEEIIDDYQQQEDPLASKEKSDQNDEQMISTSELVESHFNSQNKSSRKSLKLNTKLRKSNSNLKTSTQQETKKCKTPEQPLETPEQPLKTTPEQLIIPEQQETPSEEQSSQLTKLILRRLNKKADTILEFLKDAEKERADLKEIALRLEGEDRVKTLTEELSSLVCSSLDDLQQFDSQWFENPEPALLQYLRDIGNIGEFLSKHCTYDLLGSLQETDIRKLKMFKVAVGSTQNPIHTMKLVTKAKSRAKKKVADASRQRKKALAIRYLTFENENNLEECRKILLKGEDCDRLDAKVSHKSKKFNEVLEALREKTEAEGELKGDEIGIKDVEEGIELETGINEIKNDVDVMGVSEVDIEEEY